MLVLLVILLLAVALGYPYWSAVLLRAKMLRRLERVCRSLGFRLRPLRSPLAFARNRSERYDLVIENKSSVLAVKLWSAYRRDGILVITEKGRIFVRRYAPTILDVRRNGKQARSEGRPMAVRRTVSPLSEKDRRPLTTILLIYPSYRAILCQNGQKELALKSGDAVFDKILMTPSSLEDMLRKMSGTPSEGE